LVGLVLTLFAVLFFDAEIAPKAKSLAGVAFASFFVLLFIGLEPWLGGKLPAWVFYLAEASYVLYLFHPLVAPVIPEAFSKLGIDLPLLSVLIGILAAVGAAVIIHAWIEKPITKWLKPYIPYAGSTKHS
jgi:exopolysaccharide production protein ExoZ